MVASDGSSAKWSAPIARRSLEAATPDGTIVVGLDGSANSATALRWAIDNALLAGSDICVVHALEPLMPTTSPGIPRDVLSEARTALHERATEDLEEWIRPLHDAGTPYRTRVTDGSAADAILRVADDERARMIVVGRRGQGTFARLLLGSVSHRLAQQSPIPVVVVPAPDEEQG